MADEHVNVSLLKWLDVGNMDVAALFSQDVIWHFFKPLLSDIQDGYAVLKVTAYGTTCLTRNFDVKLQLEKDYRSGVGGYSSASGI